MNQIFDKLIEKCHKKGLRFLAFEAYTGIYIVVVHDAKKAGMKPKADEMRDSIDYRCALDSWYRRGEIIIGADKNLGKCLNFALDYLDNL